MSQPSAEVAPAPARIAVLDNAEAGAQPVRQPAAHAPLVPPAARAEPARLPVAQPLADDVVIDVFGAPECGAGSRVGWLPKLWKVRPRLYPSQITSSKKNVSDILRNLRYWHALAPLQIHYAQFFAAFRNCSVRYFLFHFMFFDLFRQHQ